MTVRFGLLTTANINRAVLATRHDGAPYEFVAVGSRDRARGEEYARANDIPRAHGSYDDLLADDGVDAVYIALPNKLHQEWTMRALAAGKHVLCEKPFTREPAEVETTWAEAERRGLVVMEAFMAGRRMTVAPARTGVSRPARVRTSSPSTYTFTNGRSSPPS